MTDLPAPVSTPTARPWSVSALFAALAVVLGGADGGKVALVASFSEAAIAKGL